MWDAVSGCLDTGSGCLLWHACCPAHRILTTICLPLLQVMHKAPLVEAKQIEHVANERAILGEVSHPFLVGLVGAYQDANSLYLLQVGC